MTKEKKNKNNKKGQGFLALSPLLVFVVLYLVTSLLVHDFYKVPITVAFLFSSIYAIAISKGTLNKRVETFSRSAGSANVMLMLWIFILAGAFASSAKSMGAVDATVGLTINILPEQMLLPGMFLASCFISLSIGTSVGTVAALMPIAVGIASQTGMSIPLMAGLVAGGAFFGDNLSFISDTTIVATQTQGCRMNDKFKANSLIVVPAALIILCLYFVIGLHVNAVQEKIDVTYIKVLPYLLVIVASLFGMNVMTVLVLGNVLTGIVGMACGDFGLFGWFEAMANGILGMSELIIVSVLAAGMLGIIRHNGGIDYIIEHLTRIISGPRSAEYCIAAVVVMVNICTANNTIAIITVGSLAKDLSEKYHIDPRKTASILDTMSCFTQGLLPYGAQILIAAGLAQINPASIVSYMYYNFAIGLAVILCIALRYPHRYSKPFIKL